MVAELPCKGLSVLPTVRHGDRRSRPCDSRMTRSTSSCLEFQTFKTSVASAQKLWASLSSLPTIKMIRVMTETILSHQHFPVYEGKAVGRSAARHRKSGVWPAGWKQRHQGLRSQLLFTVQSQGKLLLFHDVPALSYKVAAIFPRVLLCSDAGLNLSQEKQSSQSIIRLVFWPELCLFVI